MAKILISRPKMKGDEATSHTYKWAESVIKHAKQNNHEVIDYNRSAATYDKINESLEYDNPDVYIHFGHGCPNSLIGQESCMMTNGKHNKDYEDLQDEDVNCNPECNIIPNVKLLKDKIVIAYACHSAKRLGNCAIKYGAKAYAGFDDYLIFMIDSKKSEEIFTQPLLYFTNSVIEGDKLWVAKLKTDLLFDENIKSYKNIKYLARLLLWDKMSFKLLGDSELTIYD